MSKTRVLKLSHVIIGAIVLYGVLLIAATTATAQTIEYGPLHTTGVNADGYPVFQMRCSRSRCIGLRGKELGSPSEVARYMPAIKAVDITKLGYDCFTICFDRVGNIVGKPSPNYRNPYARP